jgi:hypothetical protein
MRSVVGRFLRASSLLPLLFVALTATGCNKDDEPIDDGSTTPTDFTVTETFSGTLFKNGAASYSFTIQRAGVITVTLKSSTDTVTPTVPAPNIGISLGSWDGTSCNIVFGIFTDNASVGAQIAGEVRGSGILCTRVYDPANFVTNPIQYTIEVKHP